MQSPEIYVDKCYIMYMNKLYGYTKYEWCMSGV